MPFFMSVPGRKILDAYLRINTTTKNVVNRVAADQLALMLPESSALHIVGLGNGIRTIVEDTLMSRQRSWMKDYNGCNLTLHLEAYSYLTEQYVTHDLTRVDLLKMASIASCHDERVIKTIGDRCKKTKHFTIPYLAAALDNEASEVIEELRREERLDNLASEAKTVDLPERQLFSILDRAKEIQEDMKIDRILGDK